MSYLQYHNIFKYLLIAFISFIVMYSLPSQKLEIDTIIKIVLAILIILFIFENFILIAFRKEGMIGNCNKNIKYKVPLQYMYGTTKEDQIKSGLNYDYNIPGYYLVNNGNFSENGISYDKVQQLITDSRYNDLYNQHNFNIIWSPHTHIGKGRGYINWDKLYD